MTGERGTTYFSRHGQEMKGEESCSLDFEQWALAEGKSVVILSIYNLLNKSAKLR